MAKTPLPKELAWLTGAFCELAEGRTFQDFKSIHDNAEEAQLYLKHHGFPIELRILAAEIKLIALRRCGEALQSLNLSKGGRPATQAKNRLQPATSLRELGIKKIESDRLKRIAGIPQDQFQRYLADCRQANNEPTQQGLLELERRLKTASRPPDSRTPTASKRKSAKNKQPNESDGHKSVPGTDFDAPASYLLSRKDALTHRETLQKLLRELQGNRPLGELDLVTLRYTERLCRELRIFLQQRYGKSATPD
jgi:hypothetical protein